MLIELVRVLVMVSTDICLFDRSVPTLALAIALWVNWFSETIFDAVLCADAVKNVLGKLPKSRNSVCTFFGRM